MSVQFSASRVDSKFENPHEELWILNFDCTFSASAAPTLHLCNELEKIARYR